MKNKSYLTKLFLLMLMSIVSDIQSQELEINQGPFKPSWESLKSYQTPEWFRDAKFGIWAHWGPQCEPEAGDWYGRNLYIEGHQQNKIHNEKYGHPSEFGFKDVINQWKANKFNPQELLTLYKNAGAKYFVAMANHHDNFDLWNSKYQPWNVLNMGPKRNIIQDWDNATKKVGLRFGVSIHASSAWSWYEVAQLSDKSGPKAGITYDGNLTKADGKGKWWEGYDPQDLYAQYRHKISPDVLNRRLAWSNPGDAPSKEYLLKFYNRVRDVVQQHQPDLVYFDDSHLPLNHESPTYGLHLAADIYNGNIKRNGKNEAVINTKSLTEEEKKCLINDLEVGTERNITAVPWQSDACIGSWHYKKDVKYKDAKSVIHALADVVSKNGNLLLSVPIRADGTIDEDEKEILKGIGEWLAINGEAIYNTRPWTVYGEGPSIADKTPNNSKGNMPLYRKAPYTPADFRFTRNKNVLYAIGMAWPEDHKIIISSISDKLIKDKFKVSLLGSQENLKYKLTAAGLEISLPVQKPNVIAYAIKIDGLLN
ncbi:alpha-L-fucosidase [Pedobacter glucosidilyticus]|uniref:alpha-L-fucosidase n=1 Tax=Pedobacter glucosidilyticus TaxID=1122941 RepID=UPI0026F022E0|nr:alpha-L-fucosidase [Pedobacter glucosidilyticus]